MTEEILLNAEEKMEKTLHALAENFGSIRTGRATPALLDRIRVDYYGVPTPITQMAGVKAPEPHMLVIEPWDKSTLKNIEHAIIGSNLGVTPSNDGFVIRLPFPILTEERRKELAKQCKEYAEEARIAVRNNRRDANNAVARMVKEESLPEDLQKRAEDEIQKLTDKFIAQIDAAFKKKEAEVMEV